MAEILLKECPRLGDPTATTRPRRHLPVSSFVHPFPYGLAVNEEAVARTALVCPNITELNVVITDSQAAYFSALPSLISVTLELEDCFGVGLERFLQSSGGRLQHLSISCSSGNNGRGGDDDIRSAHHLICRCYLDADSALLPDSAGGGQPFQLFNVGLRLAQARCSTEFLRRCTIAGQWGAVFIPVRSSSLIVSAVWFSISRVWTSG